MTIRDQMHELVDEMNDYPHKATLHANIDELPEADLAETFERLQTFRLLFAEEAEARSAQRHDLSR
jgi:hypothetical protein